MEGLKLKGRSSWPTTSATYEDKWCTVWYNAASDWPHTLYSQAACLYIHNILSIFALYYIAMVQVATTKLIAIGICNCSHAIHYLVSSYTYMHSYCLHI